MRARALRAPVFLDSLPHPTGRCAPPRPSQLRCSPKINKIYRTLSLAPRPLPHRSFADPSGNIVGSKLCTGATIGLNFFVFSFFYMVFLSFIFVILFLSFSSYSSYSSRTILCLLIFLFLYFNPFVVLQTNVLLIQIYFNF